MQLHRHHILQSYFPQPHGIKKKQGLHLILQLKLALVVISAARLSAAKLFQPLLSAAQCLYTKWFQCMQL